MTKPSGKSASFAWARYTSPIMLPGLLVLLISLGLLLAGIALIVRSRHGRLLDDHPICRRCGFDLFGLPEDAHRCSECGRDLRERNAIVHGRRMRRPGLALLGMLVIV